jgi:hypothetical protein
MITSFCDFCQFSAKKLEFFSKTNVMIKILHTLAMFRVKNDNFFAEFFGENIFKIITSVPGHTGADLSGAGEASPRRHDDVQCHVAHHRPVAVQQKALDKEKTF